MDVSMTEDGGDEPTRVHDESRSLVKTIRSLDQTGPGPNGETILKIWRLLTSSAQTQFYAAEESVLRWILKTMKGTNADAETIRMYPLTWKILACVFQRIPLFSLAKSLADRKFMVVLQQTLKRASKPESRSEPSTSESKKRRRNFDLFDPEGLKTAAGCLKTGEAVLDALQTLVSRLDSAAYQSPNDRMGAEHIRALFSQSAAEAMEYLVPFLVIYDNSLDAYGDDDIASEKNWIPLFSSLWDLHLQGSSDALEVATHLSRTACFILSKLKDMPRSSSLTMDSRIKNHKAQELEKFMHRSLILPARAAYLNRGDLEIIVTAVEVTRNHASLSSPILFSLAASAPRIHGGSNALKGNETWLQEVFKLVEAPLQSLNRLDQSLIVRTILDEANAHDARLDLQSLRLICKKYALEANSTDWQLLASAAECDVDTFLLSNKGPAMIEEVCVRLTFTAFEDRELESAHKFLDWIIRGFVKARDLSTFLKMWFRELSKADRKRLSDPKTRPIWYHTAVTENQSLIEGIEKSLTPKQLLAVVQWIDSQEKSRPEAVYIIIGFIAEAITKDEFKDDIGEKLVDSLGTIQRTEDLPVDILSLRWRIMAKTASWVDYPQRRDLWGHTRENLTMVLETQALVSFDTYEAFKATCHYWISMYPDGEELAEVSLILNKFMDRLAEHLGTLSSDSSETGWDPRIIQLGKENGVKLKPPNKTPLIVRYIDYALGIATRLFSLMPTGSKALPELLSRVLLLSIDQKISSAQTTTLAHLFDAMLANENILANRALTEGIILYLIDVLDGADAISPWTNSPATAAMRALAKVPIECFTRQQRERTMEILIRQRLAMGPKIRAVPILAWNLVLGLMVKVMRSSTFYQNMTFTDLSGLADAVSQQTLDKENTNAMYGAAHLLFELASACIHQMVDHFEEWGIKYFGEAALFLAECTDDIAMSDSKHLRIVLIQALISVVSTSPNFKGKVALFDLKAAQTRLAALVKVSLNDYALKWQTFGHEAKSKLPLYQVLVAIDAAGFVEEQIHKDLKKYKVAELEAASDRAISEGFLSGWRLRAFLIKYCSDKLIRPQPTNFNQLFVDGERRTDDGLGPSDYVFKCNRREILNDCVDAVTKNLDETETLIYLENLISELQEQSEGQLLAVYRVIGQMSDASIELEKPSGFDLATAHSKLAKRLSGVQKAREFARTAELLHLLLDQKSACMTQWNIETTLGALAATYASHKTLGPVTSSPKAFEWSCKLVEVIIKKHRRRLEGHYHVLIATMESLLRGLVCLPSSKSKGSSNLGAKHANIYTRLVTLICEPAAAAVTRSQHINSLDSATDVAKRSAGRHMYLVLMSYVKLQLEFDISHEVREALEQGMNSIFDITPPEIRKILNDAIDASGRAILREMFKRYTKFGKWSGV